MNDSPSRKTESQSLSHSSLGHFLWMFGGGSAQAILKIVVLMILSRLLTPTEFGLVAAALTVVALADVFGKIGVAQSIVQMKTLTDEHVRTGTSATLVSGILVGVIVFALADPLGKLYAIEELPPIVRAFSIIFVIRGIGLISEALIQRDLGFRKLASILVISYFFGYACVSAILAWHGAGAWSLVGGQLAQATLQTLLSVHLAGYRTAVGFNRRKLASMLRFGIGTTLAQIGNYIALNVDSLIIGRELGSAPLGNYSRAYLLLSQPANIIGNMADKVLFPVLSSAQSDLPRLERAYNITIGLTAITQIPLSVLLCIFGQEVVLVLMGQQWMSAVLPFQIMVCALFFRTAYKFTGTVLRAMGKVFHAAALQWAYALFVGVGAIIGVRYGLFGVAIATSLAVLVCFVSGLWVLHGTFGLNVTKGCRALLRHACLAIGFALPLLAVRSAIYAVLDWPALLTLVSGVLTLMLTFALIAYLTPAVLGEERKPLFSMLGRIMTGT